MRTRHKVVPALLLVAALGACDEGLLDTVPVDQIDTDVAIVDRASAEAALMGAYSALQLGSYYGGDFILWPETLTDHVEHTGTFEEFADADLLFLTADNGAFEGMWEDLYDGVYRANLLIGMVPDVEGLDAEVVDEIVGQAYGLRALHYFNLVRGWGDVPLVTEPALSLPEVEEQAQATRTAAATVYEQIEADIAEARTRLEAAGIDNDDRTLITPGFLDALAAKVHLTQREWAEAEAAARELVSGAHAGDYELVPSFAALFPTDAGATPEDIFKVAFTATDFNNLGYYYQFGGRFEVGATGDIEALFPAGDERYGVSIGEIDGGIEVVKYPTTIGSEDVHVIRYAEVLLILAEALAEQNGAGDLVEAVGYLNDVRTRAELDPYVFGVDLLTQQDVLDAIYLERRLELAFEGDQWFDLVRIDADRATAGLQPLAAERLGDNFDAHEVLWAIPVAELDVMPNLVQNPEY